MNFQTALLFAIALAGIPAGFLLKRMTEEEMKAGRKWFRMISIASITVLIGLAVTGELTPLYLTVLAFIFFIASVPLIKFKKK